MTTPDSTYWENRNASNRGAPASSALRRRHPVSGLELGWIDDLDLGERHLRLRVLGHQHRGRPLLPVRPLTAREADGAVPALELVGEGRLHPLLGVLGQMGRASCRERV